MSPVAPLTLFLVVNPAVEIRELEVAMLETNTVRQPDGSVRFQQIVAWDEARDEANRKVAIDRGYKVVKDGYPAVHVYGDQFRVVWWSGPNKVYVLNSKTHLVTETPFDREAKFREYGGWFRPCW